MAMVNYDFQNLGQPILTVEEAVKQSSYFEVPPQLSPRQVGDFLKGMAEADHKILSAEVLFLEILIVNNGACYLIYLLFHLCRLYLDHNTIFIWRHKRPLQFQMKIIVWWFTVQLNALSFCTQ